MNNPTVILAAGAGLIMLGGTAHAQDAGQIMQARLTTCITSHAAEVESATSSLTDATTFLVQDLCAVEMTKFALEKASEAQLSAARVNAASQLRSAKDAKYKAALTTYQVALDHTTIDPETGHVTLPEQPREPNDDGESDVTISEGVYVSGTSSYADVLAILPAELRATAAQAILNARRARLKGAVG